MEVTRRWRTVVGVGVFLAAWGVVVAEPVALLGSGAVAAWLLARQYAFVRAVARASDGLAVDLSTPAAVTAGETARLGVEATLDERLPVAVAVEAAPPTGASDDPAATTIEPGDRRGVAHATVSWPVAGSYAVDDVTATLTDRSGLFRQSIGVETAASVRADPRTPRDVHVGAGGEPTPVGFGELDLGHRGADVEPAGVREYVPGDAVRQIDWKATARLDRAHVYEFEAQTDRETLLVFDHRAAMAGGEPGTRKLDYAREVAMAVVARASGNRAELGYYGVGDEGLSTVFSPSTRAGTATAVREHLRTVAPTATSSATGDAVGAADAGSGSVDPAAVRSAAARLDADDSRFGRALAPFFADRHAYRERFDSHPLYRAMTAVEHASNAVVGTVVVTDDTNRAELREAVTDARQESDFVTVFLTPSVLYDGPEFADLRAAYDRYVDFEEFRRELAGIDRVAAFEVGPADRLSAVLSAGGDRRARGNA